LVGRAEESGDQLPTEGGVGSGEAEHERVGDSAGVGAHVDATGIGACRQQARDGRSLLIQDPGVAVDADAVERECDCRDGLDDVVGRLVEREPVELAAWRGLPLGLDGLVEGRDGLADRVAVVPPLLGQQRELVEAVGQSAASTASARDGKLVAGFGAGDVGADDPVAVDAGIRDEQATSLVLLEQRDCCQMVAERLVDEPLVVQVEEQCVLAVVEREPDEVSGVGEGDPAGDQVAVEPGALRAGGGAVAIGFEQPVAMSRPQRAELTVVSYLDVTIAGGLFLATVLGLLWVGRMLRNSGRASSRSRWRRGSGADGAEGAEGAEGRAQRAGRRGQENRSPAPCPLRPAP